MMVFLSMTSTERERKWGGMWASSIKLQVPRASNVLRIVSSFLLVLRMEPGLEQARKALYYLVPALNHSSAYNLHLLGEGKSMPWGKVHDMLTPIWKILILILTF